MDKRKKLLIILFYLFIFVIIINHFFVMMTKTYDEDNVYNEIITIYNNAKYDEKHEIVKELQLINPEVQGWISIEGTNVNYPLLQGNDNEYYLNHTYKYEYNEFGSIYINSNSNLDSNYSNVIIYGHDTEGIYMFSDLLNYKYKSYYDEHNMIEIVTENEVLNYEIISVFESKVYYTFETDVFRYYRYYDFDTIEVFEEYLTNVKNSQLYETGVSSSYSDQLITLVTCDTSRENGRLVVVAKKI